MFRDKNKQYEKPITFFAAQNKFFFLVYTVSFTFSDNDKL